MVSRFISDIVHNKEIVLVNGGRQSRSFTYIDDGIEAILKIIGNAKGCAEGQIFNIGNPKSNITIRELAEKIKTMALGYPKYHDLAEQTEIISVVEAEFYGKNYQDTLTRVPSIKNAEKHLGWRPRTDIDIALKNTLDFYLS